MPEQLTRVACASTETEIMVDTFTFLSPPAPYPQLFVLIVPDAVSAGMPHREQEQTEGVGHAVVKRPGPD
ncbi:hypothetical protein [Dictyobacter formicarum]|uniref:hypothetical protein n=1 Tax=Dictyobacter formicarum TaxID=2778368 RepID=UPI00191529DE|nr:hypothetical protein [Dictyobacter formicarum]